MSQLTMFEPEVWSVADLTRRVRMLLEADEVLQDVWVTGEVSNVSRPSSGHLYFTLKDRTAALRCVMWRSNVVRQNYTLRDGDALEAHGNIGVYEAGGNYQLYVDVLRPAGEGILYQEFLRLKAQLEAEGLFDEERKRLLPEWPVRIGIVTSPTGAALRDMLNTIRRRYPLVQVILAPTPVQGDEAPLGVVAALAELNRLDPPLDVILVARGGGSIEDLWAFNDERVVRAVAASQVPVISGVGHETDFTLTDFTADVRAPTPTAAAELAVPDRAELEAVLFENWRRLQRRMEQNLASHQQQLDSASLHLVRSSPLGSIRNSRQQVDEIQRRLKLIIGHRLELQRTRVEGVGHKLIALDPGAILQRGYAIVRLPDGTLVRRVESVSGGDQIRVQVSDGEFRASVTEKDGD
jgi:exodeoxyribonuclease VII large subunit